MFMNWVTRTIWTLSLSWHEDEWKWITNTHIRPAFVARSVTKWGLIVALGTVGLSFVWNRDQISASVVMGVLIAGYMFYFIVDMVAGALLEDDPVLLREPDKAP